MGNMWHYMCIVLQLAFALTRLQAQAPMGPLGRSAQPKSTAIAHLPTQERLNHAYGKLPLSFEANQGQTDRQVKFLSRGRGYTLFLTSTEAVLALQNAEKVAQRSLFNAAAFPVFFKSPAAALHNNPALPHEKPQGQTADPALQVSAPSPESLAPAVLRMKLVGANPAPKVTGLDELPGKSHYFIGNDPKKWRTNVPNYAKVKYENVYPGIDLVYYGNQRQLEYDFIVAPGADPKAIRLAVVGEGLYGPPDQREHHKGAPLRIAANGDLVIATDGGEVRFHKPVVYQPVAALYERRTETAVTDRRYKDGGETPPLQIPTRKYLDGRYVLRSSEAASPESRTSSPEYVVGFEIASYDPTQPLIIDPVLSYSTYLGGSGDDKGWGIAVDPAGKAYVTGQTTSSNFPTANAAQPSFGGGATQGDVFVSKLNASGSALEYSTYLGGSSDEYPFSEIAVDSSGNAYVIGTTFSSNFPTTTGAFRESASNFPDAFVTKLGTTGSLAYSTYLGGGSGGTYGRSIAVDSSGNTYVTGDTHSSTFPWTTGAYQTTYRGNGDSFVAKLNATGSQLDYATYLGGTGSEAGQGIAIDSSDNAYLTGGTTSSNFPTTGGSYQPAQSGIAQDAYVAKLNASGSTLEYSTYLGGTALDVATGIAVDSAGNAYIAGRTLSPNFPTTTGAFQPGCQLDESGSCNGDVFIAKFNSYGSELIYSTYLGGTGSDSGWDIALDSFGNAFVTGETNSTNFPTANAIQSNYGGETCSSPPCKDAFVAKLNVAGDALVYSTYLGGSGDDFGYAIAVALSGHAYVAGSTSSTNFPTANPRQGANAGAST